MIMERRSIVISGCSGFVGSELAIAASSKLNSDIVGLTRRPLDRKIKNLRSLQLADFFDLSSHQLAAESCEVMIHVAARAHVLKETELEPLAVFLKDNCEMSLHLASVAAEAGVRRFIYLSSVGVHGISNARPFVVSDVPAPKEDYAASKLEAEIGLKEIAKKSGMEVVIIRPPLVYGRNAPGNFKKLTKLASKNLLLPLGGLNNRKSLVALENLVDLVITCVNHPKAANETFLVSDDRDVSTSELLKLISQAAGNKPKLLPVPIFFLKIGATILGKKAEMEKLCSSLQVDITHTKETLGWVPPISLEEGIKRCFIND